MKMKMAALVLAIALHFDPRAAWAGATYRHLQLNGWNVEVDERLYQDPSSHIDAALRLTAVQLGLVVRAVPVKALAELRRVRIWFSPPYSGDTPRGAYHPSRAWLVENGRNPEMACGVEFTNSAIFEQETTRMPFFVFHELAHAYHALVLGYENPEVAAAYQRAKASGRYGSVERRNGWGRPNTPSTMSYAMENKYEYFAESSEAFFGTNDFFPFDRAQLRAFDPDMYRLLRRLWGLE